jgi:hypothetical protein
MPPVPPRGILKNAKRPGFAVDYLMQKGWAPHMAQAMVGSLMQESTRNLNPAARGDIDKHTGQPTAFGVAQWRGPRFTQLKQFAAAKGTDWTDFRTQLDFFDHELRTTYRKAGEELNRSTTLPDAMMAMYHYEGPKAPASVEVPWRLAMARSIGPIDPNYTEPVQTPRLRGQPPTGPQTPMPMEKPQPVTPATPGMMTPGERVDPNQLTPPPPDTSEEMPPEAYPPPPPTPPSDTQADSSTLKKFGELAFPDMAMDLKMPELPPIPDPPPTEQRIEWSNQWRPVQPRFRERFANLFGGDRGSGS